MKKNWKLNRGKQLNKQNNNINGYEQNEEDILIKLYRDFLNFNQEVNIRRVVDLEFSKIKYVQKTTKNITKHFSWKK